MKSIISNEKRCYICGSRQMIEVHHVYGGGNRAISEKYGLKVPLCKWCHNEPPLGVHQNKERREKLQADVQRLAMEHYGWDIEDFRKKLGRNYL